MNTLSSDVKAVFKEASDAINLARNSLIDANATAAEAIDLNKKLEKHIKFLTKLTYDYCDPDLHSELEDRIESIKDKF